MSTSTRSRRHVPRPARTDEMEARAHRVTRRQHASEMAEDYVEAIDQLICESGQARTVDLARKLGVSHVTAVRTLGRLERDGHVSRSRRRAILLTDKGLRLAGIVRERHALVVRFLVSLGIPEAAAEVDAEGIEHHVSPDTLAAFERHLRRRAP